MATHHRSRFSILLALLSAVSVACGGETGGRNAGVGGVAGSPGGGGTSGSGGSPDTGGVGGGTGGAATGGTGGAGTGGVGGAATGGAGGNATGGAAGAATGGTGGQAGAATGGASGAAGGAGTPGTGGSGGSGGTGGTGGTGGGAGTGGAAGAAGAPAVGVDCDGDLCEAGVEACLVCNPLPGDPPAVCRVAPNSGDCMAFPGFGPLIQTCDGDEDCAGGACAFIQGSTGVFQDCTTTTTCIDDCSCPGFKTCRTLADCPSCATACEVWDPGYPGVSVCR